MTIWGTEAAASGLRRFVPRICSPRWALTRRERGGAAGRPRTRDRGPRRADGGERKAGHSGRRAAARWGSEVRRFIPPR